MGEYVEVVSKKEFEERCETKVELVRIESDDRHNLPFILMDYFEEEELEELSGADTFVITGWDSHGWCNSINPSGSFGIFLAKGNEIFFTEEAVFTVQDKKKAIKEMAKGAFLH